MGGIALALAPAAMGAAAAVGDLRALAGGPVRVVWCQAADGKSIDTFAQGDRHRLAGLDTEDGRGERFLLPDTASYHKPLLTSDGGRVVYTDYPAKKIFVVQWDGSGRRELGAGVAADTWRDPRTGREWVYAITGEITGESSEGRPVVRFPIDDPKAREVVWDKTAMVADNLQLSADGTHVSGLFPWPHAGVADLAEQGYKRVARGCWPSLAPDNSYMLWVFDGAHRNVTLFPLGRRSSWKVPIDRAPGIDGYEVYHPRWANHPRYLAITGPYKGGDGRNRIGAGGDAVEVYVGRFSADFARVEQWVQATRNPRADFYPDVWMAAAGAAAPPATGPVAVASGDGPRAGAAKPVTFHGKLVSIAATPTPASIKPYKHALVVYVYDVERIESGGALPEKRVAVAHWGIRDEKQVDLRRRVGDVYPMRVERYEDHPELEGERQIIESDAIALPLYYDVSGSEKP